MIRTPSCCLKPSMQKNYYYSLLKLTTTNFFSNIYANETLFGEIEKKTEKEKEREGYNHYIISHLI